MSKEVGARRYTVPGTAATAKMPEKSDGLRLSTHMRATASPPSTLPAPAGILPTGSLVHLPGRMPASAGRYACAPEDLFQPATRGPSAFSLLPSRDSLPLRKGKKNISSKGNFPALPDHPPGSYEQHQACCRGLGDAGNSEPNAGALVRREAVEPVRRLQGAR